MERVVFLALSAGSAGNLSKTVDVLSFLLYADAWRSEERQFSHRYIPRTHRIVTSSSCAASENEVGWNEVLSVLLIVVSGVYGSCTLPASSGSGDSWRPDWMARSP